VLLSYRIIPAKGLADKPLLLDCTAPGLLVLILLIRLSALFNSSCRGKMSVNRPALQHLPLASQIRDAAGNTEYRFATFFIEAILLAVLLVVLLSLFSKLRGAAAKNGKSGSGSVWMMFLLWYSALEIVMDSTRYDSSFARVNGFVSVVQTFCGLMMLAVLVWYSVRAVKADGLKAYQWLIWSVWLVLLGGAGVSEYLVQRHGNWYLSCYYLMSSCLVIMSWLTYRMYRHQCVKVY
jgi:prolipoprotein diacylglyceryltransferase